MMRPRGLGVAAAVTLAVLLAGCASKTEYDDLVNRVGMLEQSNAALEKRIAELAAGDRAAAERAAAAAEEARRAAEAARMSSERTEQMFNKSLRK